MLTLAWNKEPTSCSLTPAVRGRELESQKGEKLVGQDKYNLISDGNQRRGKKGVMQMQLLTTSDLQTNARFFVVFKGIFCESTWHAS